MLEDPYGYEEERPNGITIIPLVAIAAGVAFALAAALFAGKVFAESYSIQAPDGDFVRLSDQPCKQASGWLKLKSATMRHKGKDYAACWFVYQGHVFIIDEAMDASTVPQRAFKRDTAV